jgi:hypothetical protein
MILQNLFNAGSILMLDKMKISSGLVWNSQSHQLTGFVELEQDFDSILGAMDLWTIEKNRNNDGINFDRSKFTAGTHY